MNLRTILSSFLISGILLFSCDNNPQTDAKKADDEVGKHKSLTPTEDAENYVAAIDTASLLSGESLYYSKPDGTSVSVEFWLNDSNQVVKAIEYYTTGGGSTVNKNFYYYKDGRKYVTRELFDDSKEDEFAFMERITYYKDGKPAVTKIRRAQFEEQLDYEGFTSAEPVDLSDERIYEVLNQTGDYATTFRGIIRDEHMTYLLVGPNKKDGFTSAISIQYQTELTRKLIANERAMIGTPLIVNFKTAVSEIGFEFQVLTALQIAEE